jgi:ribose transport system ATP-binding protein
VGAGRTELARAIFGIDRPLGGDARLDGRRIAIRSPRDAIDHGIFLVPEDRKRSGLVLDFSVTENVSLANLKAFAAGLIVRSGASAAMPTSAAPRSTSARPSVDTLVGTLSGGNQQKVV